MNDTATLPAKHKTWTKAERALYANATVRVLGAVDRQGRIEVEITSGPLAGLRRWFSEAELVRQEAGE